MKGLLVALLLSATGQRAGVPVEFDVSARKVTATGSTTARALRDRFSDVVNVADYATPNDGNDDTAGVLQAVAVAVARGKAKVYFPAGTWEVASTIASATSGVHFTGDGPGATIIKARAGFSGSALFILGNKSTTTVTTNVQLSGMTLDANGQAVTGFEAYGLRDGSGFDDVYVKDSTGAPAIVTGQAGAGAGQASSRMCEGVQFRNVWAIGGSWSGTAAWKLDGIFESQVIGGGARGYSTITNTSAAGILIGDYAEARGVTLYGATVVMLKDAGDGSAKTNAGIRYGQWTRDCKDLFSNFEGITGSAVHFHGSEVSGNKLPSNCQSISPRIYSYGQGQDDGFGHNADNFFNPVVKFGVASDCRSGPLVAYSGWKTWVRFDGEAANGQQRNRAEIIATTVKPDTLVSSGIVSFDAASAGSNWVEGLASDDGNRRPFFLTSGGTSSAQIEYATNGSRWQHDGNRSVLFLPPTSDEFTVRSNGGTDLLEFLGATPQVNAKARFNLSNAWNGTAPLTLGANWIWVDASGRPRFKNGSAPSSDTDGQGMAARRVAVTYGASMAINAGSGTEHVVTPTDGAAFTIATPTSGYTGQRLTLRIRNTTGGALGAVTWSIAYKLSIWTQPATGFSRAIDFQYDGTNWIEVSRTPADVPN